MDIKRKNAGGLWNLQNGCTLHIKIGRKRETDMDRCWDVIESTFLCRIIDMRIVHFDVLL